ncbi:MAG: hypothetical protein M0T80_07865 [Actinomycetota bacterium]|nr:hypothetical protein [Actinomycetota bacterium]
MHVGVEEDGERPGQVGADRVVLVEIELGEERLVAEPAGLVLAALVDGVGVAEQVEAVFQLRAGLGVVAVEDLDPGGDVFQLTVDAVLLALESGEGDGVGVIGVDELGLLGFELVPAAGQLGQFGLGAGE